MTKNLTLGLVLAALVLVAGGAYLISTTDSTMMQKEGVTMVNADAAAGAMLEGSAMPDNTMVGGDAMVEKSPEAMHKEDASMMKKDEGAMMKKGSYEAYSADKLALANSGDVVLFFRASWCPTCKAADANIRANMSAIPGTLTILDVNYDSSTELKKKYGVTYQHTFVQVSADGTMIKKWSGSSTLASLVSEVQ